MGDTEYDKRFGNNYAIARLNSNNEPARISSGSGFASNSYCTYVIVKDRTKQGIVLNVTKLDANVWIYRANKSFISIISPTWSVS